MRKTFCNSPGCGQEITGPTLARSPRPVNIDGIGRALVSFRFTGPTPDVCDKCLLQAAGALPLPEPVNNVTPLPFPLSTGGRARA